MQQGDCYEEERGGGGRVTTTTEFDTLRIIIILLHVKGGPDYKQVGYNFFSTLNEYMCTLTKAVCFKAFLNNKSTTPTLNKKIQL